MPLLSDLFNLYNTHVNFLFVYILEAHASDEWPIRSSRSVPNSQPVCIPQTKSIDQRKSAAQQFVNDFDLKFPLVMDDPQTNQFEKEYAPWPLRIYIIDENKILRYLAFPSDTMLELNELKYYLSSRYK